MLIQTGGPPNNAAKTFGRFGHRAILYSPVGRTPLRTFILEDIRVNQVELIDLEPETSGNLSVSSVICVPEAASRAIVYAKPQLLEIAVKQEFLQNFQDCDIFLMDGMYWHYAEIFSQVAQKAQVAVVFDGGSWKSGTERLLPQVDVAICSENFSPPGTTTIADVVNFLRGWGIAKIAITRGEKSILFSENDAGIHEIAVPQVTAVDTLGAGDVFHGAFCHYYATSRQFPTALAQAARIAAHFCTVFGMNGWFPP